MRTARMLSWHSLSRAVKEKTSLCNCWAGLGGVDQDAFLRSNHTCVAAVICMPECNVLMSMHPRPLPNA